MTDKILGYDWEQIKAAQMGDASALRKPINTSRGGDHGADPVGDGTFRMVPSGDIVDFAERNRRLVR